MSVRTAFAILGAAGTAAVVLLLVWHALVVAGVLWFAWRYVRRDALRTGRRRRPRSSWAKLIEAGALAAVAWNTRHINGGRPRVTPGFTLGLGRRLKRHELADDDTVPF